MCTLGMDAPFIGSRVGSGEGRGHQALTRLRPRPGTTGCEGGAGPQSGQEGMGQARVRAGLKLHL